MRKRALEAFFNCVCRFLYLVGIQTIRILRRIRRRLRYFFMPLSTLLRRGYSFIIGVRLQKIKRKFTLLRRNLAGFGRHVRKRGFVQAARAYFRSARKTPLPRRSFVVSILNFAVPVCSVFLLLAVIQYWNGLHFGLVLSNGGEPIAAIQDEGVYEEAAEMVNQRMVHDTARQDADVKFSPGFQLTSGRSDYASAGSVCDLLIRQSNGIIEEAGGLYVDGKLLGTVKSSADLRYMLENLLDAAKGEEAGVTARFTRNVEIISGLYPTTSMISTDKMREIVGGTSKAGTTYMVKDGDTVTSIAHANHTTVAELKRINQNLGDSIHPGDLINLQVAIPALEIELVKTVTYEETVPYTTVTQNDDSQYTDYSKVVTQGVNGKQRCVDTVHMKNGAETGRESLSKTILVQPVNKVVVVGTKKRPVNQTGVASGKLIWPVPALHTITTYFTWRWGKFHTGIDISGSGAYGKTIVAADGGTVVLAGPNDGYGYCVILNHHNGKSTLYGHCSTLLVSAGESVSKGQPIAKIGSTGNSTGPHCHFEVIVGGKKVNPLDYVS